MADKSSRNPFDPQNLLTGGGLWDQKVVTFTSAKTATEKQNYTDQETGEPVFKNLLIFTGIAEDQEAERRETYSTGKYLPTEDGLGLRSPDPAKEIQFHKNSELGRLAEALAESGFDGNKLYKDGRLNFTGIVGATFLMRGEPVLDQNGKAKKNKKGFDYVKFWPAKFVGFKEGVVGAPAGGPSPELREKAIKAVLSVLDDNGGKASRADTVRKISGKLAGDPDVNKIIALISREDFHRDVPWTRDGTTYSKVG